jgi:prepilin-type N-terminal cleavage/methylation domain-containing protein
MTHFGKRGYTAVEVMVSLAILAIGAAAVISMQRGAVQGNVDARRIDTANSLTRLWMERLRRDATLWTVSGAPPSASPLLGTVNGDWHAPTERIADTIPLSPAFDLFGNDLSQTAAADGVSPTYCTQVRLTWLVQDQLIRADVRVFWPRGIGIPMGLNCTGNITNTLDTNANNVYRFVYASTAIRRTVQ